MKQVSMSGATQELDEQTLYTSLQSVFPAQNDYVHGDYQDVLQELRDFNIHTRDELQQLLLKHRERVLFIDREPLDDEHMRWYAEDFGEEFVHHAVEHGYWIAYIKR